MTDDLSLGGDPIEKITYLRLSDQKKISYVWDPDFEECGGPDFAIDVGVHYMFVAVVETTWNPTEYTSEKDIFCLHETRKVNGYSQITWKGYKIRVPVRIPRKTDLELHIIPHRTRTEVRLWHENQVIKVVHFKP